MGHHNYLLNPCCKQIIASGDPTINLVEKWRLVTIQQKFAILYAIIVWGHVLDENHTQEKKEAIPTTSHLGISEIV